MGILGAVIVAAAAGLAYAVSKKPEAFRVTRSARLAAPAAVVFGYVDDFRRWAEWSPWEKLDPALQRTYSGPARGVGAVYEWSGNAKAGAGRMTIKESVSERRIAIELVFFKPVASTSQAEFTFQPSAGGVDVTWTMDGRHTLMGRLFSVFVDMDKPIGSSFEDGLANLGRVSASAASGAQPGT
jgi:hypothetical protein